MTPRRSGPSYRLTAGGANSRIDIAASQSAAGHGARCAAFSGALSNTSRRKATSVASSHSTEFAMLQPSTYGGSAGNARARLSETPGVTIGTDERDCPAGRTQCRRNSNEPTHSSWEQQPSCSRPALASHRSRTCGIATPTVGTTRGATAVASCRHPSVPRRPGPRTLALRCDPRQRTGLLVMRKKCRRAVVRELADVA